MAEAEAQKYKAVMDTITGARSCLNKAATVDSRVNLTPSAFSDHSGTLYGEYFEVFDGKIPDWTQAARYMTDDFKSFVAQMERVNSYAMEQYFMWSGRIGLRHPDPLQPTVSSSRR
jgi:hypothetical protein